MQQIDTSLPDSEVLNIGALSRLFKNTTNSYKFIFFISIMDILVRRKFDIKEPISFVDLTVEMLANAWFPHTFFRLSFGTQDTIAKKLDSLALNIEQPIVRFHDPDKKLLRKAITSAELGEATRLMEFVPYRLLIPFFEHELANIDKCKWMVFESAMPSIVNNNYETSNPLYKFDSDNYKECKQIFFNPLWCEYIKEHFPIIYSWVSWHWLQYMQKRNPSTPGISNKLFMPVKRDSLSKQNKYWKRIIDDKNGSRIRCIYSGTPLKNIDFSLDHYLPWSFVAHDQLWNLIPTLPSVNSAKSNNLPDEKYFKAFVQTQFDALIIAKQIFSQREFDKQTEQFISDLALKKTDDLLDFDQLYNAYKQTIGPLSLLAVNQGFYNGWHYN